MSAFDSYLQIVSAAKQWELNLAVTAVKAEEVKLTEVPTGGRELKSKIGREWKIEADTLLESVIIPILQNKSDYPILSEESGSLKGKGEKVWIVDPLDGSVNYFRGLPMYCVSVGLWEKNKPILGVVLDVSNNQLFTGIVGQGARCNGDPIEVNKRFSSDPSSAVLCTGLSAGLDHNDQSLRAIISLCTQFGKVRMLGSAALMLCCVASGRCDSYWERQIGLWDVAAGLAIVVAAGGKFKMGENLEDLRVDLEAACTSSLLVSRICG